MIAIDVTSGDRHGRIFMRHFVPLDESAWAAVHRDYMDDEDRVRASLLREALARPSVPGAAHPGVEPTDVINVYLNHPDPSVGPLFACVLVSHERLSLMLNESPVVLESFSLQVVPGTLLTQATLHAAIETWAARNFPEITTPRFIIEPWLGDADEDVLDAILEGPTSTVDSDLPDRATPGSTTAKPPYEEAA